MYCSSDSQLVFYVDHVRPSYAVAMLAESRRRRRSQQLLVRPSKSSALPELTIPLQKIRRVYACSQAIVGGLWRVLPKSRSSLRKTKHSHTLQIKCDHKPIATNLESRYRLQKVYVLQECNLSIWWREARALRSLAGQLVLELRISRKMASRNRTGTSR